MSEEPRRAVYPTSQPGPTPDDEPTERDVEALGVVLRRTASVSETWVGNARAILRSDWYSERIAQARREGAAEALNEIENLLARPDFNWWQRPEDLRGSVLRLITDRAALRGDEQCQACREGVPAEIAACTCP